MRIYCNMAYVECSTASLCVLVCPVPQQSLHLSWFIVTALKAPRWLDFLCVVSAGCCASVHLSFSPPLLPLISPLLSHFFILDFPPKSTFVTSSFWSIHTALPLTPRQHRPRISRSACKVFYGQLCGPWFTGSSLPDIDTLPTLLSHNMVIRQTFIYSKS